MEFLRKALAAILNHKQNTGAIATRPYPNWCVWWSVIGNVVEQFVDDPFDFIRVQPHHC
jgi:hypothetical protein